MVLNDLAKFVCSKGFGSKLAHPKVFTFQHETLHKLMQKALFTFRPLLPTSQALTSKSHPLIPPKAPTQPPSPQRLPTATPPTWPRPGGTSVRPAPACASAGVPVLPRRGFFKSAIQNPPFSWVFGGGLPLNSVLGGMNQHL